MSCKETCGDLHDAFWNLVLRAGPESTFLSGDDVDRCSQRELALRPLRRYADSLGARFAAWRRWERWAQRNVPVSRLFSPTPGELGKFFLKVAEGGPTAASTTWSRLRWWARSH